MEDPPRASHEKVQLSEACQEALTNVNAPVSHPEEDLATLSGFVAYIRRWGTVVISTCTKADCRASLSDLADKARNIVTTAVQIMREFSEAALEDLNKEAVEEMISRHEMKEEKNTVKSERLLKRNILSAALLKHPREVARLCMKCRTCEEPEYLPQLLQKRAELAFQVYLRFEISLVSKGAIFGGIKYYLKNRTKQTVQMMELLDNLLRPYNGKDFMTDILVPRYGAKFDYIGDELYPIVGFDSMIWFDENGEPIDDLKEEMEDIAEEAAKREQEELAKQLPNFRPSSAPARQQLTSGPGSVASGSAQPSSSSAHEGPSKRKTAEVTTKRSRDAFNLPPARVPRHQLHSSLATKRPNMPKGLPRAAVSAAVKKGPVQKPSNVTRTPSKARDAGSKPVTPQSRRKSVPSEDDFSGSDVVPPTDPRKNDNRPFGAHYDGGRQLGFDTFGGAPAHQPMYDEWNWTDEEEEAAPAPEPVNNTWMVSAAIRRPQPPKRPRMRWATAQEHPAHVAGFRETPDESAGPSDPRHDALASPPGVAQALPDDICSPMRALRDALVVPPTPEPDADAEVTEEHESSLKNGDQEVGTASQEGRVQSALFPQAPVPSAIAKKGPLQQACSQAANSLAGQAQRQSDARKFQPLSQNLQETNAPNLVQSDRQQGGGKPSSSPRTAKENAMVPREPAGEATKPAGPIPQRKKSRKTTGGRTLPLQYPTQPQREGFKFSIAQGGWIKDAPKAAPSAASPTAPVAAPAHQPPCGMAKKAVAPVALRAPSERISNKRKAATPSAEMPEAAKRSRAQPRKEPTTVSKPTAPKPAQSCEAGSYQLRKSARLCIAREKPFLSADQEIGATSAGVSTAGCNSGSKRPRDGRTDEIQLKPPPKRERRMLLPSINEDMPLEEPASGLASISDTEPAKSASTAAPAGPDQATAVARRHKGCQTSVAAPAQLKATRTLPSRAAKAKQVGGKPVAELNAQADTTELDNPRLLEERAAGFPSTSQAEPAKSASTALPGQATAVAKGRKPRQKPAAAPVQVQATRILPPRAAKIKQAVDTPVAELNAQADTTRLGRALPLKERSSGLDTISHAEPAKSASTAAPAAAVQATAEAKSRKPRQTPAAATAQVQATRVLPPRAAKTKQAVHTLPVELNAQTDNTKSGSSRRAAAAPAEPATKQDPPARAARGKPAAKPAAAPAGRAATARTRSTVRAAMSNGPARNQPSPANLAAPLDAEAASALLELSARAIRQQRTLKAIS